MSQLLSIIRLAKARFHPARLRASVAPAPVRPLVMIQSDDWGRCGAPSCDAVMHLKRLGLLQSLNPWDFYGLETADDVEALTQCLGNIHDRDGRTACMTGNIIMGNLDTDNSIHAICSSGLQDVKAQESSGQHIVLDGLPIYALDEALPPPWGEDLPCIYRAAEATGTFRAELHGLTHFSTSALAAALANDGNLGDRARAVLSTGTPYLRSVTPELNFALVDGSSGVERPLSAASQSEWISQAIEIFNRIFDRKPTSFCPPGYRHNQTTIDLLKQNGINSIQLVHKLGFIDANGVLAIGRNVSFEPVLEQVPIKQIVENAYQEAMVAVREGRPIVICSHSINYINRHLGRRDEALDALETLLQLLLRSLPDLRFCYVDEAVMAWRGMDVEWYKPPGLRKFFARIS